MRRIIYASSSSRALTSTELDNIASQAQKNNSVEGITGLLLYGDHSFFQVLEGADESIESVKQRIWDDPRHRGLSELQDKSIETATFSDWSMGCYRVDSVPSSTTLWVIVDFESIQHHLPTETPLEVLVLARTFFTSIAPREMISR